VEDPVEALDEERARPDHGAPHEEGTEHAPEEDAVLVLLRDAEVAEDQDENEDVVDAERLLDQIARQELEPGLGAPEVVDPRAEGQRQEHPEDAPDRGLLDAHLVGFAVEDEEVEGKERQHERVEADPRPDFHPTSPVFASGGATHASPGTVLPTARTTCRGAGWGPSGWRRSGRSPRRGSSLAGRRAGPQSVSSATAGATPCPSSSSRRERQR